MGIKKNQLKKFLVKDLKKIIKERKIGKITKKSKSQLIAMIQDCDECKDILSKLSLPKKVKKKFSAKQLAAQAKFKAMVSSKKDIPKIIKKEIKKLENLSISELKDMAMDKGIHKIEDLSKDKLINIIKFGKDSLKKIQDESNDIALLKPIVEPLKKKIMKKEIAKEIESMIEKKVETISNKKIIEKIGKKDFLDGIFGVSKFNLRREIKEVMNEIDGDRLEIFLSLSKKDKKALLEKRFSSSLSITNLIKRHIKI